jgi:UPF0755 protein
MKKLIIGLVLIAGFYSSARLMLAWDRPNSDSTARVTFEVPPGVTLSTISDLLEDKELIRDAWAFKMFARYHKLGTKFQAGDYIIQRNLNFSEVAELLQTGKSEEIKITIPEGSTIAQIDAILTRKVLIEPGDFIDCARECKFSFSLDSIEGYLFPSTYFVNPNQFTSKKFVQRLYRNFDLKVQAHRVAILESGNTLNELVIVASMIEREANNASEMPLVADVIWKRLREGIPLGIDATTRYEKNDWKTPLYTEDFEIDSQYNTRRNRGLPPTAISNFSEKAFEAALFPEENDYYYYLHDPKGQIHFAETLEGHNQNKQKYLY